MLVHALVNVEVLAGLDLGKSAAAVRAAQRVLFTEAILRMRESGTADFTEQLSALAVVTVKVLMRGTAFRADTILGDVAGLALVALYGFDDLAVSLAIVIEQGFPGPTVLMVLELRKDVGLELLVVRRL